MNYRRNEDKLCQEPRKVCNELLSLDVQEGIAVTTIDPQDPNAVPVMSIVYSPEPVMLDEVKRHLRIDFPDEDDYLTMLIPACRAALEKYCAISMVAKTITWRVNNSAGGSEFPYGPVREIVAAFSGTEAWLFEDYTTTGLTFRHLTSKLWDATFTYTAGYTTIPSDLKLALLHEIAFRYEHRGDEQQTGSISAIAKSYAKNHKRTTWIL